MQGSNGLWWSRSICWEAVCRSGSADNFCRQALSRRGDWLSRLCARVFGRIGWRVDRTSGTINHLRSQSTPRSIRSFCPRLLSKMELFSTSHSCRAICFCSLGTGAEEQVFAGIDGSERHISRYTTSPRSPFSFGRPWNPRSGDHECAWVSNIKDSGKNPYWGDNRWQAAVSSWWGISSCLPSEECTGGHPQGEGEGGLSWMLYGLVETLVLADLSSCRRKARQRGSLPFQWTTMICFYTKVHSETHWHYGMAGNCNTYMIVVHVVVPSLLTTPWRARLAASPSIGTTRYAISQPTVCARFVKTWRWSLNYSHWRPSHLHCAPHALPTVIALTSGQKGCGPTRGTTHSSKSGYFTLTAQAICRQQCQPCISALRGKRNASMARECERLSSAPLPPLFSLPRVGWELKLRLFTDAWPDSCPSGRTCLFISQWNGWGLITKNGPYTWGNFHACAITKFENRNSWAGRARRSPRALQRAEPAPARSQRAVVACKLRLKLLLYASGSTGKEDLKADRRVRHYKEVGLPEWPLAGRAIVPRGLWYRSLYVSSSERFFQNVYGRPAPVDLTIHTFRKVDRTTGRRF